MLREHHVDKLSESIEQLGLQCPISVARAGDGQLRFVLSAGRHRLKACQKLGWTEIPVIQVELDPLQRELWEIDENLCRVELTELEKSEHLSKRKELYEQLHPDTRQHVAGARAANASMKRGDATANSATASFANDTSGKIGMSPRAIRQATRRATKIAEDVKKRIRSNLGISDNGTELDALASLSESDQVRVIDLVDAGTCKSIKEAKRVYCTMPAAQLPSRDDQDPATIEADAKRVYGTMPAAQLQSVEDPAPTVARSESTTEYGELIKLLVTAALRAEPMPEAQQIANLLRCCGFNDFADRVTRGIDFGSKLVSDERP
jgi:hypothetical protein